MDATNLRFLTSAALLLATFLWTNCADAKPPQAPPVRKCFCEACQCGPSCTCASGECRCPTCKDRLQVQPFGVSEELPTRLVRFTADWCGPCRAMQPDWDAVSLENRGLMSELDMDANQEYAQAMQVRTIPAILVMQGDKVLARYVGRMNREQLRTIARRWKQ
jgi:thiol-disulfide isomerase/thioredoxin